MRHWAVFREEKSQFRVGSGPSLQDPSGMSVFCFMVVLSVEFLVFRAGFSNGVNDLLDGTEVEMVVAVVTGAAGGYQTWVE